MRSFSLRNLSTHRNNLAKERQKNYDYHVKKVIQISNQDSNIRKMKDEQNRISQILSKSKEISRKFLQEEELKKRMNQNMKMVSSLIDIKTKPRMLTQWQRMDSKVEMIRNHTFQHKKNYEEHQRQLVNEKIIEFIADSTISVRKFKNKMRTEIDQYIKRRNHLQIIKNPQLDKIALKKQRKKTIKNQNKRLKTVFKLKNEHKTQPIATQSSNQYSNMVHRISFCKDDD